MGVRMRRAGIEACGWVVLFGFRLIATKKANLAPCPAPTQAQTLTPIPIPTARWRRLAHTHLALIEQRAGIVKFKLVSSMMCQGPHYSLLADVLFRRARVILR